MGIDYSLAMYNHWSHGVTLDAAADDGAHPPPELQQGVGERTGVAVPFGEVEL